MTYFSPAATFDNTFIGTEIRQANIPLTITSSGYYTLMEDITGVGNIITISTGTQIIIDLNGKTISGGRILIDSTWIPGAIRKSNTYIKNGILRDSPAEAIIIDEVATGTEFVGSIVFENLTIQNCATGIYLNPLSIYGILIKNVTVYTPTNYGFYSSNALDLIYDRCSVEGGTGVGFYATLAGGIVHRNCHVSGITGDGFSCILGDTLTFSRCTASEITGNGFVLDNCSHAVLKNTHASSNTGIGFSIGPTTTCFDIYAVDCNATQNNTGFSAGVAGNNNIGFVKCQATENTTNGFFMNAGVTVSLAVKCKATGNGTNGFNINAGSNCVCVANYAYQNGTNYTGTSMIIQVPEASITTSIGYWSNIRS